jgi:hypothetical protein
MTHTPRPRRVVPSITNQCDRQHVRVRQMNRWPHMDPNPRDSTGHASTSTHTRHLSCTRLAPLRRHRRRRTHVELVVDYSSCLFPHAYVGAVGPSTGNHKDEEALSAPTGCEDALTTSVRATSRHMWPSSFRAVARPHLHGRMLTGELAFLRPTP